MKILTISGPHGVGKDSVIAELLNQLRRDGIPAEKALFYTTRKLRAGEREGIDILTCSMEEYERKMQNGEFAFTDSTGESRVATPWSELKKAPLVITNISARGSQILQDKIKKNNEGEIYSVFMEEPRTVRHQRISLREGILLPEMVDFRLDRDPSPEGSAEGKHFDLVTDNPEGKEAETAKKIYDHMREFVGLHGEGIKTS